MKNKTKNHKLLLVSLFFLLGCSLLAQTPQGNQDIPVEVTVVDNLGSPLAGATAQIVGKNQGVLANADGKVSLLVKKGSTIEFRYLGMITRRVVVNKPLSGNIILEDDVAVLDQVVVTGYQRTTKRRTTGSVATIDSKELKGAPTANLDLLMQGKVAGVNIQSVSGRPGQTAKIRIRGTNTITGNADPLWIVDGVPLQRDIPKISSSNIRNEDFNDIFANGISGINPNDIASVTVLKDASAAAIYGSRAAGGVIVVTTKRGESGKMKINYSTNFSLVSAPPRNANLMNSKEKLAWEQELWDEFSASRLAEGVRYPVIGAVGMIRSGYGKYEGWSKEEQDAEIQRLGEKTTNWFEELFHNSVSQSHYLSLSGGTDKTSYYISGGFSHNNGLVKKTDYKRYNVSSKLDFKPNSRIKLGINTDLGLQESGAPSLGVDPFKYAYFANPYEKAYNDDNTYAADNTFHSLQHANRDITVALPDVGYNIFREINETSNKTKNLSASIAANLSIKILNNLSFEGLASYGYVSDMSDNINGENSYAAWIDRPFDRSINSKRKYGSILQTSAFNTNYNLRGQFNYFNTFAQHHYLSMLFGAEIRGQYAKSIYEKRYGYDPVSGNSSMPVYDLADDIKYTDLISYAAIMDGLSGQSIMEDAFASFYFSLDYVLRQRYILSLTARTDGSNNFGSKEQFNPTGSIGLAWNIDQENFMEHLKPTISSLALRTSFGFTGNINKHVYPQLIMDYLREFHKTEDGYFRIGRIMNAPNPHLRWEKTRDMKLSLDAGFFNERLRFQGELYDRRTYDAVTNVSVPSTTGFTSQSFNTSELLNQGAEFTLSATLVKSKDWTVSASTNIAYNRNKLLKYNAHNPSLWGNYVGYPLGAIISGKVQGIDKKFGVYTYEPRPDTKFSLPSDRALAENYAFYLGTSNAPTNGGYSISASYKQLSLGIGGSYSIGGKVKNTINSPAKYNLLNGTKTEKIPTQENDLYANFLNVSKDAVNRWTPSNPITTGHPRIIDAYGENFGIYNYVISSDLITSASMLENVSYFKVGSLYLNYNFPQEKIKRFNINSLSLSCSVSNLLIVTNYSGIDPETPGAVYPTPRTYSLGMSIAF